MEILQIPDAIMDTVKHLRENHIEHREYCRARDALYTHINFAAPGSIIILIGPSRVGKSRVAKAVKDRMMPNGRGTDSIPCISCEAVNPDRGQFSMKHLTLRMLNEIRHPIFGEQIGTQIGAGGYHPRLNATEPMLRLALEAAFAARGTKWVFIDEAHHIMRTHTEHKAMEYLDSLKSLGNTSGITSIWIAGYELLLRGFTSTHLNGRIRIIHFPRYQKTPEDRDEFCSTLAALSDCLPFQSGVSLLDFVGDIYAGTSGSIGAVVNWTEAALAEMVIQKARYLGAEHYGMSRRALQIDGLEDENIRGEDLLQKLSVRSQKKLKCPLELDTKVISNTPVKRKGFSRNPKRDLVGAKK